MHLSYHPAVEEAAAIASVSLRPLEGMEAVNSGAVQPRDGAALTALLKLCNGWQKPGAAIKGQCILVSRTRFEVDILYHADVIGAFKQMPTKSYGNKRALMKFPSCAVCVFFTCLFLFL